MAFQNLDQDGNGVLTIAELSIAFSNMGLDATHEEIVEFLKSIDPNNDGLVSFDEYLEILANI